MIDKIVSGGQTGVDRAALDVARVLNIPRGGWCPQGRLAEDGPLAESYPLEETSSDAYTQRTRWNVRDSDGTLILTIGKPSGGTGLTKQHADSMGKPCLVLDLDQSPEREAVFDWITTNEIHDLNIAGPRRSNNPEIYEKATRFLMNCFNPNS